MSLGVMGTKNLSQTQGDVKNMVYMAYAGKISWKGYDFFTKIKHLKTFIDQNTFISNHENDIMRTPYSGESISFVRCKLSYVRFFCLLYRNGHYWE